MAKWGLKTKKNISLCSRASIVPSKEGEPWQSNGLMLTFPDVFYPLNYPYNAVKEREL